MKPYNYLYMLAFIVTFATGCGVSKDIPLPASETPDAFRNTAEQDIPSIATLSVKEFINEPEIQELIDTALLRNLDLQLAVKNIEAAEILLKQARLGNLPVLNLQLAASSNRPSDNSLNGLSSGQFLSTKHIEDYEASLGLSWEADIWGKIKRQKQASLATYLQTNEAKKALQTRIVANVAQGFYQLLMLDAQLEVARKNRLLSDSTLNIIRMQFDAGQVTSLAIQQAEAQQLVAVQLIPRLEQAVNIQENALKILTGKMPAAIERRASLERMKLPRKLPSGFPAAMVRIRPDVRIAELALSRANAEVGVAKAEMYPSLVISASGGLNSLKASSWFNIPASLFGIVSGGITQPIFNRRQLKTQYELAKVDREKVVIEFRQSVLNAVGEVSDELVKIEKLDQEYASSLQRVNILQQAVKNSDLLFKNGMATYLEVITAQSNSLQSELELAMIRTAQLIASVELYRALGGGG
ncbi:efflux transporter outer membrane subunit [Pedobacter immunditicola]|uniref:efflux transporter outer membrane subunit n=1 Tax=Pedobacter immunditicola TaxID=3133440 RepID=UPI0030AC5ADA